MTNMGKRLATKLEVEAELGSWQKQWPNLNGRTELLNAYKEGYTDEVCLKCGRVFLAFHHFLTCRESGCPMRSSDKTLLQQWAEQELIESDNSRDSEIDQNERGCFPDVTPPDRWPLPKPPQYGEG